ncbi:MAG: spore protease YyaC [Thermacetogeniaceae bacterium]
MINLEPQKNPTQNPRRSLRVAVGDTQAPEKMGSFLADLLFELNPTGRRPCVLLSIGTDRSTGDSLGPLVGSRVCELAPGLIPVFGTLEEPVHAVNLKEKLLEIKRGFPNQPLIIAVDACLGQLQSVGTITLGTGSLQPGTGVNKQLPPVGDIFVSGVVNIGGFLEFLVLQNTRLALVMKMADCIARGLVIGLSALRGPR